MTVSYLFRYDMAYNLSFCYQQFLAAISKQHPAPILQASKSESELSTCAVSPDTADSIPKASVDSVFIKGPVPVDSGETAAGEIETGKSAGGSG